MPSGVTYYLSETGGLGDYSQVLTCLKNGQNLVPGANGSVVVDTNDTVVCKWTNTRQTGSIGLHRVDRDQGERDLEDRDAGGPVRRGVDSAEWGGWHDGREDGGVGQLLRGRDRHERW